MNEEILVVLPYIQKGANGRELQLALECWKKFCLFKYHFVVIGDFDQSLKEEFEWVEFIECSQLPEKENQYNPHLDMINKMNIVMEKYYNTYNGFIRMVDDNYAIKPFDLNDIMTIHYNEKRILGISSMPTSHFIHNKWKTKNLLDEQHLPCIDYTTHFPRYYEFPRLREIIDKFDLLNESYVLEDIYFNYYPHEEPVNANTIRCTIYYSIKYETTFQKAIETPNVKFINTTPQGWCKEFENRLEQFLTLA